MKKQWIADLLVSLLQTGERGHIEGVVVQPWGYGLFAIFRKDSPNRKRLCLRHEVPSFVRGMA